MILSKSISGSRIGQVIAFVILALLFIVIYTDVVSILIKTGRASTSFFDFCRLLMFQAMFKSGCGGAGCQ